MDKQFFNLVSGKKGKTLKLSINDDIGDGDFFKEGTSAKDISKVLMEHQDVFHIEVSLGSFGGSLFDGIDIHNQLINHPAAITTIITSIAASAASIIFMAGDTRIMNTGTFLMIHKPSVGVRGDSNDLAQASNELAQFQEAIIDIYLNKVNVSRDTLNDMIDNETFISADDALLMSFSNTETDKVAAIGNKFDMAVMNSYNAEIPTEAQLFFKTPSLLQQVRNKLNNLGKPKQTEEVEMKPEDVTNLLADQESKLNKMFTDKLSEVTNTIADLKGVIDGKDKENVALTKAVNGLSDEVKGLKANSVNNDITNFVDSLVRNGKVLSRDRDDEITNIEIRSGEDQTNYKTKLSNRAASMLFEDNIAEDGYAGSSGVSVLDQIDAMVEDNDSKSLADLKADARKAYKKIGGSNV